MQVAAQRRFYTPEEYLALEETAEFRSEYCNGERRLRTGGSINHNRIVGNFYAFLKFAFCGQNLEVFSSDLRLWIPRYQQYTYPDVMAIQGKPIFHNCRTDTVTNPCTIVEVLSKSTQNRDRTDKFRYYRSIPECQEYVLVNQYQIQVEQYTRTEGGLWLFREHETEVASPVFAAGKATMSLTEVYEGVDFGMNEGEH